MLQGTVELTLSYCILPVDLARYLLGLTDEEAAAWREDTIAEEQAHEGQLEQEELAAIFNEEQSRLNPPFTKRTSRPSDYAELPPIG